jgi:hypothetical protein
VDARGTNVELAKMATVAVRWNNFVMRRILIPAASSHSPTLGADERRWRVDKTKTTIGGVVLAAIVALILVALLTSVIKTIIEVVIVVGAVYLIARVMKKK